MENNLGDILDIKTRSDRLLLQSNEALSIGDTKRLAILQAIAEMTLQEAVMRKELLITMSH